MNAARKRPRNLAFAKPAHNVYVVELDEAVRDVPRFKAANPACEPTKVCLYVGITGLTPEERFQNHKKGVKASRIVRDHGLRLAPVFYEGLNPMHYETAKTKEKELAQDLRAKGHGVWQN